MVVNEVVLPDGGRGIHLSEIRDSPDVFLSEDAWAEVLALAPSGRDVEDAYREWAAAHPQGQPENAEQRPDTADSGPSDTSAHEAEVTTDQPSNG